MNPKLLEAVQDAQTLLAHAARAGIALDPSIVAKVVETGTLCAGENIADTQESDFWVAFDSLSKAVNPVTVSSLRDTLDSVKSNGSRLFGLNIERGSLAKRAVRWYTGVAIVSLLILLLVQIYWLFGTAITGDIVKVKKDIEDTRSKISVYKIGGATKAKAPVEKPVPDDRSQIELTALQNQLENLEYQGETGYNMLQMWSKLWESEDMDRASCKSYSDSDRGRKALCEKFATFPVAMEVLNVLQRYFLPLLYGLLGACVYILRTLASQIRARTYSQSSNIDFQIRLYLGTLGGMVSAWFLTPDVADGIFKSLSPFALAFLAGYSVELVFAAMDRIISAFTK